MKRILSILLIMTMAVSVWGVVLVSAQELDGQTDFTSYVKDILYFPCSPGTIYPHQSIAKITSVEELNDFFKNNMKEQNPGFAINQDVFLNTEFNETFFGQSFLIFLEPAELRGISSTWNVQISLVEVNDNLFDVEIEKTIPESMIPTPDRVTWNIFLVMPRFLLDRGFSITLAGEDPLIVLPPPLEQAATPTATPNGGTFTNSVTVTLATATEGATIYFTTDGSLPLDSLGGSGGGDNPINKLYIEPFILTATTTINAIAVKDGMVNSEVLTVTFTRQMGGGVPPVGNNRPRPPIIITPPNNNNNEPAPPERVPSRAEPTNAPILIDGENVSFQAYHISGHNFFRLRDVAYALNGTAAQFNVVWDGENNTILLTTDESYEVVGGEMVNNTTGALTANPTSSAITLNGAAVDITAFHINGNNFFMLRDLGAALGFGVEWSEETETILINTI